MNEDYKSDFRIRIDEDEPARPFLHPEVENQQIDKLRRRITFMSFFTLFLLALALTYAYIDIKKKVGGFNVGGSSGFETLSQDVESRFSSLSVKYAELEAKFSNRITALEKSVVSVKTGLDKTAAPLHKSVASLNKSVASVENRLKTIQSSKVYEKAFSSLKKETDTEVTALQKDMKNLSSMLQNMDSEYAGELAEFQKDLESAGKRLADFQDSLSELVAVSARKPTKKEMETSLQAKSLDFQDKVDELTTLLNRNDDKIESLIIRIKALKKDFTEIAGTAPDLPVPAPKQIPEPSENKPSDDSVTIKDGVKEQDIQ